MSLHRASLLFLFPALIHGLFPQMKISQSLNFFSRTFDLLPLLLFLQVMILYPNIAGNIRSFGNAYVIVAHALKHFHISLLLFHALSRGQLVLFPLQGFLLLLLEGLFFSASHFGQDTSVYVLAGIMLHVF